MTINANNLRLELQAQRQAVTRHEKRIAQNDVCIHRAADTVKGHQKHIDAWEDEKATAQAGIDAANKAIAGLEKDLEKTENK